ncbi:hypothetical protein OW763_12410 [Clostridium aestuarii]|uniref:Sporulation membrane protein YtrI C-terminal domain-containing protein n=1 Tax=Clostridium aestuarii TaxID=338193 RepID=A0ABT4D1L8_9CLOT|nr:hypothetical protein [Clostridium aestuarii]MCY6485141.1 hypothetical protein [Clostridium aestuarii]
MDEIKNKYALFFITGLFIGGIFGVVAVNLLVGYKIDNYMKKVQYLQATVEDKEMRLEKLSEIIDKKRLLINSIEVELEFENEEQDDEMVRITLEKNIKEKFKRLIGKEVEKIDGEILLEVIDKRIMKTDGKQYQMRVKRMMVSPIFKLWVEVKLIK